MRTFRIMFTKRNPIDVVHVNQLCSSNIKDQPFGKFQKLIAHTQIIMYMANLHLHVFKSPDKGMGWITLLLLYISETCLRAIPSVCSV